MAAGLNSPGNGQESSPCTPETNFRELDDAFLQTQARIWLGEILDKRFDEAINISDLLADGQFLYDVYLVIHKSLENGNGTSAKHFERGIIAPSPREITEKYPYPKVECFLRLCQTLGLEDIDLFTSSDVVQKRNTRGVCLCLRFLSKKARSKKLNVPDFDSVTYTMNSPVSMPTGMVGNRRRNLERSSSPASSSGQDTRGKRSQGDFLGSSPETSNCKSDASHPGGDEEDNNSDVVESAAIRTPTSFLCDDDDASSPFPIHSADSSSPFVEESPHSNPQQEDYDDDQLNHSSSSSSSRPVLNHNTPASHLSCPDDSVEHLEEISGSSCLLEDNHQNGKDDGPSENGIMLNSEVEFVPYPFSQETERNPPAPTTQGSDVTCAQADEEGDNHGSTPVIKESSTPEQASSGTTKMRSLVMKGTGTAALIGLVLLFFQLRNNNVKGKKEGPNLNPTETNTNRNTNAEKNRSSRRVYPSDRLHFG